MKLRTSECQTQHSESSDQTRASSIDNVSAMFPGVSATRDLSFGSKCTNESLGPSRSPTTQ